MDGIAPMGFSGPHHQYSGCLVCPNASPARAKGKCGFSRGPPASQSSLSYVSEEHSD